MKSALALFSQPRAFVSFVGTKEKGRRLRATDHYQGTGSWSFRDCIAKPELSNEDETY
ncbi:MAG TPA: hypothetical protein VFM80_00305 [Gracilimonas sp.]|uniref:hypothetical protein n=1 Tax=Gracilimonas sp. TaxID=1974203 RepID=UPI002D8C6CE2|nr:hypothetical protein [Gracilimonas sp.]